MLQLCVCRDIEHLGSLRSTQEARVALCCAWSNSYGSFVLSTLPTSSISRHTHADSWTNCRNPFYHPFKRPTMFIHEDMHWVKCLWKSWVMNKTSHPRRPRGGQSGLGIMRRRKFSSTCGKAPGYPLSPDHFQTVKGMLAPDWAQKMLCIIVPNRRTASPEFFSWVRTRLLLTRSRLVCLMHQRWDLNAVRNLSVWYKRYISKY